MSLISLKVNRCLSLQCNHLLILVAIMSLGFCSCGSDDEHSLENTPETSNPIFVAASAVDMGLSVQWASRNMGELTPFTATNTYAWGDPSGMKESMNLDEYPTPFPPECISGTQYDIATQQWGEGWRMPLISEFIELWNNSNISIGEVEGVPYYKFTSRINGEIIYLPYEYSSGFWYWSGELNTTDTRTAVLFGSENSTSNYTRAFSHRYNHYYIRPVYEGSKITTVEAENITGRSARLKANIPWLTATHATEAGFYISKNRTDFENNSSDLRKIESQSIAQSISISVGDLSRNTNYYFRGYIVVNGQEYLGNICEFTTPDAYLIGDAWPNDENPVGVVFYTSDNGLHGKIVSLDHTNLVWQSGVPTHVQASNLDDGSRNSFPSGSAIPRWVQSHGAEWYCPAKNELNKLCSSIVSVNNRLRTLNCSIIEGIYWSSTQYSTQYYDMAYVVNITENGTYLGYSNGWSSYNSKSNSRNVLAVKKF